MPKYALDSPPLIFLVDDLISSSYVGATSVREEISWDRCTVCTAKNALNSPVYILNSEICIWTLQVQTLLYLHHNGNDPFQTNMGCNLLYLWCCCAVVFRWMPREALQSWTSVTSILLQKQLNADFTSFTQQHFFQPNHLCRHINLTCLSRLHVSECAQVNPGSISANDSLNARNVNAFFSFCFLTHLTTDSWIKQSVCLMCRMHCMFLIFRELIPSCPSLGKLQFTKHTSLHRSAEN